MKKKCLSRFQSIATTRQLNPLLLNAACIALVLAQSAMAYATTLTVQVTDELNVPIENVAVYAESASGEILPKSIQPVDIAQRKRQFVPLVTVTQVGTEINFPNYDSVKHHVYSFSATQNIDLPLYSGKPSKPQLFDKLGTVVLGCNIHDQMIAYVQVVNTPYFGKTDAAGKVKLAGMIPGKYTLKAWHFKLPATAQVVAQPMSISGVENTASFKLNVK